MALKDFLKSINSDTYIIGRLDEYLLRKSHEKDDDRRWDINSPSMLGVCKRALYQSRLGMDRDLDSNARVQRIFDNGTKVHERLEGYMLDAKIAIANEIPVINDEYQIMGHADLLISLFDNQTLDIEYDESARKILKVNTKRLSEIAVGEIKSINDRNFTGLKEADPKHKKQASSYMFCLEQRRQVLHSKCKNLKELMEYLDSKVYNDYLENKYGYLTDGAKYTAEEKINHKITHFKIIDVLLFLLDSPITKMIFLYENKNDQNYKEFVVEFNKKDDKEMREYMTIINNAVRSYRIAYRQEIYKLRGKSLSPEAKRKLQLKYAPPKEGTSKSHEKCRWCQFKTSCFTL